MIAKIIRNYDTFVMVMHMSEGIRRRRSLARFQRQYPTLYSQYQARYEQETQEPEPEQKPRRGRRKKAI